MGSLEHRFDSADGFDGTRKMEFGPKPPGESRPRVDSHLIAWTRPVKEGIWQRAKHSVKNKLMARWVGWRAKKKKKQP